MEYLIQLNDGPLDGVELSVAGDAARLIRSLSVNLVDESDVDNIEDAEVKTVDYDLYIDEPTANDDGGTLCFYHDRSTLVPKHPLAKIRHYLPPRDREYWSGWMIDITQALDECFQHVSPETRHADRAIKAYETAQRRLAEMPKLGSSE
ncbi:hypothetical protein [Crateriforma conspicua]|uniref:hypothetical protein n=1 Tax=Crateriforma conspicua TaxID=2527996 RepID=UPI00118C9234|nr:hypothetical protein [Crateriforma conspicua]QDV62631.1 hypothetical protein Mal65_17650 [Crateriforma conspicua]